MSSAKMGTNPNKQMPNRCQTDRPGGASSLVYSLDPAWLMMGIVHGNRATKREAARKLKTLMKKERAK